MSVRTSTVVAGGLLLLSVVGVTTIFGESLLAWISPPAAEVLSAGVTGGLKPAGATSNTAAPSLGAPVGAKKPGEPGAPGSVPSGAATAGAGGAADTAERNP